MCIYYQGKKKLTHPKACKFERVGQTGFEPTTSTSRTSRATNCAIARIKYYKFNKIDDDCQDVILFDFAKCDWKKKIKRAKKNLKDKLSGLLASDGARTRDLRRDRPAR